MLTHRIARMSRRTAIDRAPARTLQILRHMRGAAQLARDVNEFSEVIGFVGTEGGPSWPLPPRGGQFGVCPGAVPIAEVRFPSDKPRRRRPSCGRNTCLTLSSSQYSSRLWPCRFCASLAGSSRWSWCHAVAEHDDVSRRSGFTGCRSRLSRSRARVSDDEENAVYPLTVVPEPPPLNPPDRRALLRDTRRPIEHRSTLELPASILTCKLDGARP
jgi:hypothetical protein